MAFTRLHSMRDFFRIWFSWKFHATMIFFVIVGVITLFSLICPRLYESKAKILILPKASEEIVISAGESVNRILPVSIQDINTEIELLTSDDVLRETVKSFEGTGGMGLIYQDKPWYQKLAGFIKRIKNQILLFIKLKDQVPLFEANVALLRSSLKVEPVAMSNIILVSLRAENPKEASIVLNRLLETYITKHNNSYTKEEGIHFLNTQATEYFNKLTAAEKELNKLQKEWNISDFKKQREANIVLITELTEDLNRVELSYNEVRGRISILKRDIERNKNEEDIIITKEMREITSIVELEKSIVPLLVKRSELQKSFNPSSREYRDLESQIKVLREEVRNEIIRNIKQNELELETLGVKRESLKKQLAKLQRETGILNEREITLTNLEREIKLLENNYMLYASKTEDARIYREQKKQDLATVYVADKASIPVKPSFPQRFLMFIVSIFTGSFAALGIPFLLEFLDHRIKTPGEVEDLLSLPVICDYPEEK